MIGECQETSLLAAGRELEQAAAQTLANVGGLQNLSDTPEPAYLKDLMLPNAEPDLELRPHTSKDQSTPELGKPVVCDLTFEGKENVDRQGHETETQPINGLGSLEKHKDKAEELTSDRIMNGGKSDIQKNRTKSKVPWR